MSLTKNITSIIYSKCVIRLRNTKFVWVIEKNWTNENYLNHHKTSWTKNITLKIHEVCY